MVEGIMKLFGPGQPKTAKKEPEQGAAAMTQTAPQAGQPDQGSAYVPHPQPVATPTTARSATAALELTLARFETMPQEMSELRRTLGEVLHRFEDALDHLGLEAKRLSTESSSLALMTDRLQARLSDLERALSGGGVAERALETPMEQEAPRVPEEPQFRPSDQGVSVVLASVPGFQGLMDVQRALSGLPEAENASVVGYRNGEASLKLVLREPVTPRAVIDALARAGDGEILIEESKPEAQRLRLRFVEKESRR
jgi:hypothetical protein